MTRLLITGGAGFIGSHIAEAGIRKGWDVCVVDNLSSGKRENVPSAASLEVVDLRDKTRIQQVLRSFRPTHVCHQAAQASVAVSVREPQSDAEINIIGSLNVMSASVEVGVKKIVFASTGGAIYGEVPEGTRASVDQIPVPVSPYACSKFSVEKYLECFRRQHGLDYSVLRYANVYGPRQDPHGEAGVVAIFCNRMLAGDPVQINARKVSGDPGCIRDYVYVDDVVSANLAALEHRVPDRILNVGTGRETATRELVTLLQKFLDTQVAVTFGDRRPGDVERSLLDASRYIQLIGPVRPVEQGLQDTAKWFQSRRKTDHA